ncbi:MAG TPA: response regulator transcription factor [Lacisediminihabitans sp.]|uniref:response regulator transcription factor n=1 Tax=Lacisediminihabitans sp. TaxID=2787631 RepID=UPI002EDA52CD
MCAHIMVAEDDPKQAELMRRYLEHEHHSVTLVHDGRSAIDEARRLRPALLVLDLMLPVVDGLDVARILRAESTVPILMLTARSSEEDLLLGLDLGADDYMTKPFSPRELTARVRAILRRLSEPAASAPGALLRIGPLTVDPLRHLVELDGVPVTITPGEFRLLQTLAAEPERVFSREQLLEHMHGFDRFITTRTIDVHVMNVRKKIEPHPRHPRYLVTVFGVGYKLTEGTPADAP